MQTEPRSASKCKKLLVVISTPEIISSISRMNDSNGKGKPMNKITILLALALSTSVFAGSSQIKVIYGEDNRVDVVDSANSDFVELARSSAAMFSNSQVSTSNNGEIKISGRSLQDRGMCAEERFASQPSMARCSGFLVGENLLVTAGHCVKSMRDCSNYSWVFDYKVETEKDSSVTVSKDNVYKCKSIISQELTGGRGNDYALIELKRKVTDRRILKTRKQGKVRNGDKLVVIGHPSGLPTKIADGSTVRSLKKDYFVADLDTYGGNSGSAVFNVSTGVVEGILVRGETDYVRARGRSCQISNVVEQGAGRGEDVTYITNIAELLN